MSKRKPRTFRQKPSDPEDPKAEFFPEKEYLLADAKAGYSDSQYNYGRHLLFERKVPRVQEGFAWLEKACENDHAAACRTLGQLHAQDKRPWYDLKKSQRYLEKAVELGDVKSKLFLGRELCTGALFERDVEKGLALLIEAKDEGSDDALVLLAQLYAQGSAVPIDLKRSIAYLSEAVERGHEKAKEFLEVVRLVDEYYTNGNLDIEKAKELFLKRAENGEANYQYMMGALENELSKDTNNAPSAWMKKAADKGLPEAICELGRRYFLGEGLKRDQKKAVSLFTKAANKGYSTAQCMLSVCYTKGLGVRQDPAKGVYWMEKAANQGDRKAQVMLAALYIDGNGIEKDAHKGAELLKIPLELGLSTAQFYMGLLYLEGEGGVEKDLNRARELFEKSAAQNFSSAYEALADMYREGNGVEKDEKKADELHEQAIEVSKKYEADF